MMLAVGLIVGASAGFLWGWIASVRVARREGDVRTHSASVTAEHLDNLARLSRNMQGADLRLMLRKFHLRWGRFVVDIHKFADWLIELQQELHVLITAWEGRLDELLKVSLPDDPTSRV